jgi:hypothetical protein
MRSARSPYLYDRPHAGYLPTATLVLLYDQLAAEGKPHAAERASLLRKQLTAERHSRSARLPKR